MYIAKINCSDICLDFDECSEDTDYCAQICVNVVGRYICSCGEGYRIASNNQDCNGKICKINHTFAYTFVAIYIGHIHTYMHSCFRIVF